ncbi:MAG: hypothetical protein L6R28_12215 [Planctomycetes bacterium]|nr:hypothetical protein [Planctomycetota bacterium]
MKKSEFFTFYCDSRPGLRYFEGRGKDEFINLMEILTGEKTLKRPIELRLRGKKENDIIPGKLVFCVSKRFVNIMTKNGVSGWTTYPVAMRTENGKVKKDIVGLRVVGRAGPLTAKARKEDYTDFDLKTWDGSDFFCLEDTAQVLITRKVADILAKEKIAGATYRPITERR